MGSVFVGQHPEWITFTPDGKFAYFGAAGANMTVAVDVKAMKVVANIPVGTGAEADRTAIRETQQPRAGAKSVNRAELRIRWFSFRVRARGTSAGRSSCLPEHRPSEPC